MKADNNRQHEHFEVTDRGRTFLITKTETTPEDFGIPQISSANDKADVTGANKDENGTNPARAPMRRRRRASANKIGESDAS